MTGDLGAKNAVAAGEFDRRLAHRAAAEERPQHHRIRAAARQPLAVAGERQRLRLRRVAGHAQVLAVRQPPAMQRILLHRRHHGVAVRMDRQRGVAALPFQPARAVGLRRDKPQGCAVVVRGADALALGVEGETGDRGGMRELLQLLSGLVEQVDRLADAAGEQPLALVARMTGDVLHPFHAEVGDIADCAIGADATECSVIAAGQEACRAGVGSERERRSVVHVRLPPVLLVRDGDEVQRSVAEGECRRPAGAIEACGDDECVEVAMEAASLQQELGDRVAHDVAPPPPAPSRKGRGSLVWRALLPLPLREGAGGGGGVPGHPPNPPRSPRTRGAIAAG